MFEARRLMSDRSGHSLRDAGVNCLWQVACAVAHPVCPTSTTIAVRRAKSDRDSGRQPERQMKRHHSRRCQAYRATASEISAFMHGSVAIVTAVCKAPFYAAVPSQAVTARHQSYHIRASRPPSSGGDIQCRHVDLMIGEAERPVNIQLPVWQLTSGCQ